MALLIHFLACPEPNITSFNNKNYNTSNNIVNSMNDEDMDDIDNNEDKQDLLEGFTEYDCNKDFEKNEKKDENIYHKNMYQ